MKRIILAILMISVVLMLITSCSTVEIKNDNNNENANNNSIGNIDLSELMDRLNANEKKILELEEENRRLREENNNSSSDTGEIVIYPKAESNIYLGKDLCAYQMDVNMTEYTGKNSFSMGGTSYHSGISSNYGNRSAYYNLDGKYETLSGFYGSTDEYGGTADRSITIFGDDNVLIELTSVARGLPQSFSIDVTGVRQLQILFGATNSMWNNEHAIGDAVLN